MPEWGNRHSLWANTVPYPRPEGFLRGWLPQPEELGLSGELGRRLAVWSRQWQDNYLLREDRPDGRPRWRAGFDLAAWVSEGEALLAALREELPDYEVVEKWRADTMGAVSTELSGPEASFPDERE